MRVLHETPTPKGTTNRQSTTHLPIKAPGSCPRAYLVLMLGAAMLCTTPNVAQPSHADPDGHQAVQPASSGFTDPDVCATCHKEVVKSFANDPHNKPVLVDGGKGVTCESCHGPGTAHAKDGDTTLIFDPATAAAKQVDEKCLACHDRHGHFERSAHGEGNVSCAGCHVIHAPGAPKPLLKMDQPRLCFQCHSDVKPQFSMPFHHKVEEGLIECTDCHDVHGALGENTLPSSKWQFKMCTKCHTSTAGPFVYEHAAVTAEGCSACHLPHGGPNPKMLIQADINKTCLLCHFPPPNAGAGQPAVPEHIQSAQSQSCISCHSSIHGSNTSAMFLGATQVMGAR
ncbi:MAG: DmsE family decaheme c-type cytochrome [Terracidiphilus sp.]